MHSMQPDIDSNMGTTVLLDLRTLDRDDLNLSALKESSEYFVCYDYTSPEEVEARIAGAEIVITNKVVLNRIHFESNPQLGLVCVAATGTNNVDMDAAGEFGISVMNVTGYATPSVVQHVFALITALNTRLFDYRASLAAGEWQKSASFCLLDHPITELSGKTLGIIGYGELGKGVETVARAFGMQVLIAQRPGGSAETGRIPLQELLSRADIVSLHVPLAENTRDLIGAEELNLMKNDALLINTARGGIVDETALVEALKSGTIGGAGFDVLSVEPPVEGNPLLEEGIPNLVVTPHIAWASRESRQRLLDGVARNIDVWRGAGN